MFAGKNTLTGQPEKSAPISYRWPFMLVTSLFFMWGLSYGLLDVLNKHFQLTLHVNKAQSGLLQAAYFGAYFIVALPAGFFMDKRGYRAGIILGLLCYAVGALLFIPAAAANSFALFLFALFVIASGLGCLETAANPFATVLGDSSGAERRLNLAQSFNGLGQFLGPMIGGSLFFTAGQQTSSAQDSVKFTYVGIAVLVLLIAFLFYRTNMPDIREQGDARDIERGVTRPLWQHKHFTGGVIAQFFYIAAQVGVGAFFINYVTEHWQNISNAYASYLLSVGLICFMVGRFVSTWLMGRIRPATLLSAYALINIVLCVLVVAGIPGVAVPALIAVFFFMSIMFPTIFAMGVKNMGAQTKRASSIMIMSIVGGAIMPWCMGALADRFGTAIAYTLPVICFVVVLVYGLSQRKAEA
ncbi:Fucose permease [Paramixta manurensis]|uniref:Fucose permease n=1 Tax=Paramixta manurensis TaxID=2740817 RepID=A0A6M8UCZ8_9GAMM|nr:Fucose permease [Erwiniaceae bacterium PD-1]